MGILRLENECGFPKTALEKKDGQGCTNGRGARMGGTRTLRERLGDQGSGGGTNAECGQMAVLYGRAVEERRAAGRLLGWITAPPSPQYLYGPGSILVTRI